MEGCWFGRCEYFTQIEREEENDEEEKKEETEEEDEEQEQTYMCYLILSCLI